MYTVTESFHEACKSPGRSITSKITFNGVSELAASEIQEIVVSEQCGSSDGVTIGASFSSQCKVTIYKQTATTLSSDMRLFLIFQWIYMFH